mmetsp:Transcript_50402/g.122913  ORF Transcript_50402/g.122913 Transcript_50402/m.122913 type:complete len:207 (-) Transcript_50402:70-690(-)
MPNLSARFLRRSSSSGVSAALLSILDLVPTAASSFLKRSARCLTLSSSLLGSGRPNLAARAFFLASLSSSAGSPNLAARSFLRSSADISRGLASPPSAPPSSFFASSAAGVPPFAAGAAAGLAAGAAAGVVAAAGLAAAGAGVAAGAAAGFVPSLAGPSGPMLFSTRRATSSALLPLESTPASSSSFLRSATLSLVSSFSMAVSLW